LKIRKSTDSDLNDILDVQIKAFGNEEGPKVAGLVSDLLSDPTAVPLLSLIAVNDNQIVGHILFSQAKVNDSKKQVSVVILAPLSVIPDRQRQGIGGQLIEEGFRILLESNVELVFVLGHPEYYPHHGFKPAGILGFEAPYPIPTKNANAWMVRELVLGAADDANGKVFCADALDKPEYWRE
jgi:predicted N-acetyltransferase YhbS